MRRCLFIIVMLLICMAPAALTEDVTCLKLIENAKVFDGSKVSITGEVIGDILVRGDYAWVNVNDKTSSLGTWIEMAKIDGLGIVPGRYDEIGTVVTLEGTFYRACAMHSGETDIHVEEIKLVETSKPVEHRIEDERVIWAVFALLTAFILTILAAGKTVKTSKGKGAS